MWKIKNTLIKNWMLKHLTHSEIVTLLYFSLHQNDAGWARGMYYDLVAKSTGISKSSYYNACDGLKEKGIIQIEKEDNRDRNILILDNDFRNKDFQCGYIDLCHKIFQNPSFWKMKANEILLAIDILKICASGKHAYIVGQKIFLEKYAQIFDLEVRTIKEYMRTLKEFFSVQLHRGQYSIAAKIKKVFMSKFDTVGTGEADSYRRHVIKVACGRAKIDRYSSKDIKDTADLINQYRNYSTEEVLIDKIERSIKRSIEVINKGIKHRSQWEYSLNSKLVHQIFRRELNI